MKTIKQIKEMYQSKVLDGRDLTRLAQFMTDEELELFGLSYNGTEEREIIPFTKENVLKQLEEDVEFGFQKTLGRRGISASLMFEVVRMWNWVLEDGLEDWDENDYAMYGLPLFKATAVKYGFDNPIRDDSGSESWYNG